MRSVIVRRRSRNIAERDGGVEMTARHLAERVEAAEQRESEGERRDQQHGQIASGAAPTIAVVPTNTRTNVPSSSAGYLCHCFTRTTSGRRFVNGSSSQIGAAESVRF